MATNPHIGIGTSNSANNWEKSASGTGGNPIDGFFNAAERGLSVWQQIQNAKNGAPVTSTPRTSEGRGAGNVTVIGGGGDSGESLADIIAGLVSENIPDSYKDAMVRQGQNDVLKSFWRNNGNYILAGAAVLGGLYAGKKLRIF